MNALGSGRSDDRQLGCSMTSTCLAMPNRRDPLIALKFGCMARTLGWRKLPGLFAAVPPTSRSAGASNYRPDPLRLRVIEQHGVTHLL